MCEIEIMTDYFVFLKKQGKQSKQKHLSKEVIRKITHKQTELYIGMLKMTKTGNYKL